MRDIALLNPGARGLCILHLDKVNEALKPFGLQARVISTLRTMAEQTALYARGRKPLAEVNRLNAIAGLPQIKAERNVIVTWTMNSRHLKGNAWDIGIFDLEGKYLETGMEKYYTMAGEIAEDLGITWGGRFKDKEGRPRPDMPHFQAEP